MQPASRSKVPRGMDVAPEDHTPLFTIERREEVATIYNDPNGKYPPLLAGFMAASDYIAAHQGIDSEVKLEWDFMGNHFIVAMEPSVKPEK